MVHWPEVMVTYEETEQILFSADAFGSFGALNGHLFADEVNFDRDWLDDARRYTAISSANTNTGTGSTQKALCPFHPHDLPAARSRMEKNPWNTC